jgi:hypothetical protein
VKLSLSLMNEGHITSIFHFHIRHLVERGDKQMGYGCSPIEKTRSADDILHEARMKMKHLMENMDKMLS